MIIDDSFLQMKHDRIDMPEMLESIRNRSPEEKEEKRKLLESMLKENEERSSKSTSELREEVIKGAMERHGISRARAEQIVKAFGG